MITYAEAQELCEIMGFIHATVMDNPNGYIEINPGFAREIRRAVEIANLIHSDIEAELSGE